jgi:hypothetical protein
MHFWSIDDESYFVRERKMSKHEPLTLEGLETAIKYLAWGMVEYKKPELQPTLSRLVAERDRMRKEGDALDFARRVLSEFDSQSPLPQPLSEKR